MRCNKLVFCVTVRTQSTEPPNPRTKQIPKEVLQSLSGQQPKTDSSSVVDDGTGILDDFERVSKENEDVEHYRREPSRMTDDGAIVIKSQDSGEEVFIYRPLSIGSVPERKAKKK
jgi:hypothetical protein